MSVVSPAQSAECLHRWSIRAAHTTTPHLDPIIPSWTDARILVAFFHRMLGTMAMSTDSGINPESVKDKATSFAVAALDAASNVVAFAQEMKAQHVIKTDDYFGLKVAVVNSEATIGSVLSSFRDEIDEVKLPVAVLNGLKKRFIGRPEQFLLTVYVLTNPLCPSPPPSPF